MLKALHYATQRGRLTVPTIKALLTHFPNESNWVLRKTCHGITVADLPTGQITDISAERDKFRLWQAPNYFNFARDVMDVWAEKEKNNEKLSNMALWLVDEDGINHKLSFCEISRLSKRFANVLTSVCGLGREDRIMVVLPRVTCWWVISLACIRSGIVMIPGTVLLTAKDVEFRVSASGARCVITTPELTHSFDEALTNISHDVTRIVVGHKNPGNRRQSWLSYDDLVSQSHETFECADTRSDDPMLIYFTSGTTGLPKMTEHSHSSYTLGHFITARYSLNCFDGDIMYNMSDLGWAKAAYSSMFGPWMTGATVFQHNVPKFDADVTLKVLSDYPITNFCAPPTAYRQFITRDLTQIHFKSLRHCTSAGEPVNAEILEAWKEGTGLQIYEFYGQTETTLLCGNHPAIPVRPGSMGMPAPGCDLQIVDSCGNVLKRGNEGDIAIRYKPHRPVGLFSRYVGDPEKTASRFVGDFYLTGDRAIMDDDGYVWFVGRNDDVIISSGYRIGPFEVESVLLEHPAVLESAVVSSPDPERGEVVKAFVVLNTSHRHHHPPELVRQLQEHVKSATAPYKYPRKIEFIDELPKTISGKIRRIELRNREWMKTE